MKKILYSTVLLCFLFTSSFGQTQQGSVLAGGNISASFDKQKSEVGSTSTDVGNFTQISFSPKFGYFIVDGMAAGLSINLSNSKFKADASDFESTNNSITLGPFFRYYHDSGLFGHAEVGFGSLKNESSSGGTTVESKFGLFSWMLGPGYAMFLNENVAIEGMVGFQSQSQTLKDSDPEQKDILLGPVINFGFQVFIN